MDLPEKKDKQIIIAHIKRCMNQLKPGDIIYSSEIYAYIKRNMNGKRFDDTPGRYLRTLRKEGKLNYTCLRKDKGMFKIIEPSAPHSL